MNFNTNPMKNQEDYLSQDQIKALLDIAKSRNHKHYLFIKLALVTGRRVGELLLLKPEDIKTRADIPEIFWNIEKKYKRIKNDSGKFVCWFDKQGKKHYATEKVKLRSNKAIDVNTYLELNRYISDNNIPPNGYVFSNDSDYSKPITRQAVWLFIKKYAKELGMGWVHPHTTRHTFSAIIAENMKSPADLRKLQKLLEHSNIQITEAYLNFSKKEESNLLEESFGEM